MTMLFVFVGREFESKEKKKEGKNDRLGGVVGHEERGLVARRTSANLGNNLKSSQARFKRFPFKVERGGLPAVRRLQKITCTTAVA